MKPTDVTLQLGASAETVIPLAKAPHILVAGMTGAGKSVVVHSIIKQLLDYPPRYLNIGLVDPKRVELTPYRYLPHVVSAWPYVAYTAQDAEELLGHFAITELGMRFHHMQKAGVRSFDQMEPSYARTVIVIDELANLILDKERGNTLERYIVDIASMGRACGIHLILATQSPRRDVVTGLIKANVPTRIALATDSAMESRIVLDSVGAEMLTPPGEMLVRLPGRRERIKTRGIYVSDADIDAAIGRAMRR